MKVPYIPEDAPFSEDQRAWLAGFLAGMQSRLAVSDQQQTGPGASAAQAAAPAIIDILFGTQTGNAEEMADGVEEKAKEQGFATRKDELNAITMDQLKEMETVIVVISTYGEGEMPDSAELFWEALSASTAPRLEGLHFAVLALGDTNYDEFCQAGKLIDTRLEQLGASRLIARVDCDVDYYQDGIDWTEKTLPLIDRGDNASLQPVASAKDTKTSPKEKSWSRKRPYASTVVENIVLSGKESAKEIRHISLDLGDSGLAYEAGDAVCVVPTNGPDLVESLIVRLGAQADAVIDGEELSLGALLTRKFEIRTPSRDIVKEIEKRAEHAELSHILANGDKEALEAFLWGKDILDLLNLNPSLSIRAQDFVSWLKPLQHRAYSISSSPKAHAGEVHMTVAAVRWQSEGREHRGVASTYLADLVQTGSNVPIFMTPNKSFRVPEGKDTPMIMVGPGTGIAPFRAFLEERREIGATGKNWLFFGDQHRACDFIYEDELSQMSKDGLLTRLDLAFSRDQDEKIYVQNRMRENAHELFDWLEQGGHFYVCGDATRMAKDVDAALLDVIQQAGNKTEDAALEYVTVLKREKRYVRDIY